ncbi:MAG TPA: hypothetical protein VHX42_01195 [Candidatus Babeliales bacterium]|jgi:hypothetical protein|nr:hypothetical protein [Candidatus Babeliales bacterium]
MKKIIIVVGIALVTNTNNSFYGSQLIQKEYDKEYTQPRFLDAETVNDEYTIQQNDEYQAHQIEQTSMDEYDEHVCDEAQSPKISSAEALIKEMFGFVLLQYLAIKEVTHIYYQEIKQTLHNWFSMFVKA